MKNKILKLHLLCVFVAFLIGNESKAQDSLYVYDLSASFDNGIDTSILGSNPKTPPALTQTKLNIYFKVNNPDDLGTLYIQVGQQQNGTEFKNEVVSVMKQNDINVIMLNKIVVSRFWNKGTHYQLTVPIESLKNVHWLTVYAKDKNGKYSVKKYFKIQ